MKKFLFYLMALPSMFVFVACGDDGDDNPTSGGGNNSANGGITVTLTAANFTKDGYFDGILYYKITSNSPQEVTVSKAETSAVVVEIPAIVNIDGSNYKCTSISENAFAGCRNLATVSIPATIKAVEAYVFRYCSSLTSIVISNSVTSIGEYAFAECSSLISIDIPSSVTSISKSAFSGCI